MAARLPGSAFQHVFIGALLAVGFFPIAMGLAQSPQQRDRCLNKGVLYSYDQQIDGCTAVIIAGRPRNDLLTAYYNRGYAYYRTDRFESAIADFSAVIKLNPADAHALNGRCWLRTIVGRDLREALDDCNESLRLRADDPQTLDSRGFTCLKLGQFNHAIADYDAALALYPRQAESFFGRGVAKLNVGAKDAGNADIAIAKGIDPGIVDEFAKYGVRIEGGVVSITPQPEAKGVDCARAVAQLKTGPRTRLAHAE